MQSSGIIDFLDADSFSNIDELINGSDCTLSSPTASTDSGNHSPTSSSSEVRKSDTLGPVAAPGEGGVGNREKFKINREPPVIEKIVLPYKGSKKQKKPLGYS